MKLILLLLGLTISFLGNSQADSCRVIRIIDKSLNRTSQITESYSPEGIYLLQNAIYNLKISGQTFSNYRILKIWNDSLQIAWTLDSIPAYSFAVSEIQKVMFPSLNNGVSGFPHPSMNPKKYQFEMYCRTPYRIKPIQVCLDDECENETSGYPFVVSGYKWKSIIRIDGKTLMIDNQKTHTLERN